MGFILRKLYGGYVPPLIPNAMGLRSANYEKRLHPKRKSIDGTKIGVPALGPSETRCPAGSTDRILTSVNR